MDPGRDLQTDVSVNAFKAVRSYDNYSPACFVEAIAEARLELADDVLDALRLFRLPSCVCFPIGSEAVLKRLCGSKSKYSSGFKGSAPATGVLARLCIGLMRIASGLHDHR